MNRGLTVVVCEGVEIVEEQVQLSLADLCHSGGASPALVAELVAHGLLEPAGGAPESWRFGGVSLAVARRAQRLVDDLGLNAAGAAVVIELLQRIDWLERNQGR
jgi:chaperone modulatory protein CbpM